MTTGVIGQNPVLPAPGVNKQVAFNDAGILAGDAGLTYDKATDALNVVGPITSQGDLTISKNNPVMTVNGDSAIVQITGTDANPGYLRLWDTTDGGFNLTSNEGDLYIQSISGAPAFLGNILTLYKAASLQLKAPSGSNQPTFSLDTAAAGVQANIIFYDNGVGKWYVYKDAANNLAIYNNNLSRNELSFPPAGGMTVNALAGTGNRMVEANASGGLSAVNTPGLVLLYSAVFSNSSGIITPNIFTSAYTNYHIDLTAVTLNTAAAELYLRFGVNGTPDLGASSYAYHQMRLTSAGAAGYSASAAVTTGVLLSGISAATITDSALSLEVFTPFVAAAESRITSQFSATYGGADWYGGWGEIQYKGTAKSQNCLQIFPSTGLITALTINVYGKRDS
jgi:hypothetical protein